MCYLWPYFKLRVSVNVLQPVFLAHSDSYLPRDIQKKGCFFVLSTTIYVKIMLYHVSPLFDMLNILYVYSILSSLSHNCLVIKQHLQLWHVMLLLSPCLHLLKPFRSHISCHILRTGTQEKGQTESRNVLD